MNDLAFHHVGVGTKDLEGAVTTYESLGYALKRRVEDVRLGVRVALVEREGHPLIELVSPLGEDHPLKSFIARKQLPSPYHTCYQVPNISRAATDLRDRSFLPLNPPAPAAAFDGALIQYFYGRTVGLLELLESRR